MRDLFYLGIGASQVTVVVFRQGNEDSRLNQLRLNCAILIQTSAHDVQSFRLTKFDLKLKQFSLDFLTLGEHRTFQLNFVF